MAKHQDVWRGLTADPPCETCPKFNLCRPERGGYYGLMPTNFLALEIYQLAARPNVIANLGGAVCLGTLDPLAASRMMDEYPDELETFVDRRIMLQKLQVLDSIATSLYQKQLTTK